MRSGSGSSSRRRIAITGLKPGETTVSYRIGNSNTTYSFSAIVYANATFNRNGGSGSSQTIRTDKAGDVDLPSQQSVGFTRTGYTLAGWSTSRNGGTVLSVGSTQRLEENTTFYAVWALDLTTVRYDANGGSGSIDAQSVTAGADFTLSEGAGFSRENHTLIGWSDTSGGGKDYELGATTSVAQDKTLFAVWRAHPKATFKLPSGADFVVQTGASGAFSRPSAAQTALAGHIQILDRRPARNGQFLADDPGPV